VYFIEIIYKGKNVGFLVFIRALIFKIWPILLIILVLWAIYWLFIKKNRDKTAMPPWQTKLWTYTSIVTVIMLLLSVIFMVSEFDDNKNKKYIPAHSEGGIIIPGKMVVDD
jgi:hypothetical protein